MLNRHAFHKWHSVIRMLLPSLTEWHRITRIHRQYCRWELHFRSCRRVFWRVAHLGEPLRLAHRRNHKPVSANPCRATWSWETTPSRLTSRWSRRPKASPSVARCWSWTSRRSRPRAARLRCVFSLYDQHQPYSPARSLKATRQPVSPSGSWGRSTWSRGSSKRLKWLVRHRQGERMLMNSHQWTSLYTK